VTHPRTIVVVGGGIFGISAALELRLRGHTVTLIDPGPIPHPSASSTDVSKMVRMDYGADVFYHELAEAALDGWVSWNASLSTPLYHETGFLVLSIGPMEPGSFEHESWRVLRERGYEAVRIDARGLREAYPAWSTGRYGDGYVSPRGGWAESAATVAWLAARCREAGVRLERGVVAALSADGSRVSGIRTEEGVGYPAELVVVCAGAWTPALLPWLRDTLVATGQPVLHFRAPEPERYRGPAFLPFAADIARTGWYGFPALSDGRVKIAHHGLGRRVDPERPPDVGDEHVERTRAFLADALPGLARAPLVARRTCLYCDTLDGDLWIDHDPQREGLVVAAGGSGHAFKFAPVLGALIADVAEHRPNRWAARFRWRAREEEVRYEAARSDQP